MTPAEWQEVKTKLDGQLSAEEARILDMLIDSKSTVEIGSALGQHRSMIWRKTERIKKRLAASP
jgi:DNA-binding CsgD family transcriptional regulator